MKKDKNLNKMDMEYAPDPFSDLGYTLEEWNSIDWINDHVANIEYGRRFDSFQVRHREKIRSEKVEHKKTKLNKNIDHWYSILSKEEIEILIDNSRRLSDEVFDRIVEKETLPQMISYYNGLRLRVKNSPICIIPADLKKLSRFPSYDHGSKSLNGSVYSFMKLWSHVFSVRKSRLSSLSTK